MGSSLGKELLHGVEVFGKDLYSTFSGAWQGGRAGVAGGSVLGPEGAVAGGLVGGIAGAIPGIIGTIKDIVHFQHHTDPSSTTKLGGPMLGQLAVSGPMTRAATFAAMGDDKNMRAFRAAAASGMTVGGAYIASGLSRVPGAIGHGALQGAFNRTPGGSPKTALLLGNGAMRTALTKGVMAPTSQLSGVFNDALYGYGHAMASNMYSATRPTQSAVSSSSMGVSGAAMTSSGV